MAGTGNAHSGETPQGGDRSGPVALAERYALATQAMTEGVYDWDIAGGALEVSGRVREIAGFDRDRLTAEDWNRRVHPDDFEAYRTALVRHFKGATDRLACEYRLRRGDGDYIWIADAGRCLRDESGRAVRLVGAVRDITGRKLAERRLLEAREEAEAARQQLVDAIESIAEGIVLFDAEDRVILCNSNYRRYFAATAGADVAAMIEPGSVFWDFLRAAHARGMLPIVDRKGGIDAYIEMRKEMRRDPREPIEQLMSDGRWLQINEHRTAGGGIASVYTDITELKRREAELSDKTEMLESLSSRLSKYLSPQIYSSIFSAPDSVEIAPKRKKLTVFFSDIAGFTPLVDALESEELTSLLNEYLTEMSAIAIGHGATVDKFIGDAIVAFFGDPVSHGVERDALSCVEMALAMQARLAELRARWRNRGLDETFELRVGIATGFCTVGNFGSEDRLDYTAIGNAVNLAARLQAAAETGGILMDNETYHLVRDDIGAADEISVTLKGFARPVRAFRLRPRGAVGGDAISLDHPAARIRIEPAALTETERADAVRILKRALAALDGGDAADPD